MSAPRTLQVGSLLAAYRGGALTPPQLIEDILERLRTAPERHAWIVLRDAVVLRAQAARLARVDPHSLPLYGIPFAVKDNIDVAELPTTAGCPDFAYQPAAHAAVVQRLVDAGAIVIGKTNLDQFAAGLVGTRSPYGACLNAYDPQWISGGSSSGSAVAVASGLVSFALGTDTAGSGRVPAAFNNLIGLKPTCGLLSTRGVVPACRSLDTVSIFALDAQDAARVLAVARGFDAGDPYSRPAQPAPCSGWPLRPGWRYGVPQAGQLEFYGNEAYRALYAQAVERLAALGGVAVEVDIGPLLEAASLLYDGPWVAERYTVVAELMRARPQALLPTTAAVIGAGSGYSAADAFRAQYRLAALRRQAAALWQQVEVLVTPTAGTIYRIADVQADPLRLNARLGRYTNFVNLLDLAAVAVPAGFTTDGLPFGVSLVAPAWSDADLLALAARVPATAPPAPEPDWYADAAMIDLAVCGAHLAGLPLNGQLTSRGAVLRRSTRTAAAYRLYALAGGPPSRPGLVRVAEGGAAIEVEVWAVPAARLGDFVAAIPAPLGIGRVLLEDGSTVSGFLCEALACAGARDITAHGGWRAWLAADRLATRDAAS